MSSNGDAPFVSVVVPMLNERGYIERCLAGLTTQTYPAERTEVLVVDGGSTDGSREQVEQLAIRDNRIKLVENPKRKASAAFNRGIEASRGDVVCLVASHGEVGPDFLERSVQALIETGAGGVGGVLRHEGLDPVSRAIGLAMTSRFGMASPFRYATSRRVVDTIGHPAYWREALEKVGPFDETLERNSDYELNYRMRREGYELVFDPDIVTVYRPRSSISKLAKQFWWYGRWKAHVVHRHPASTRLRHLVPPVLVTGAAVAPLLWQFRSGRRVVVLAGVAYASMLGAAVVESGPHDHGADLSTYVVALPTMHLSWGAGFLATLLRRWR